MVRLQNRLRVFHVEIFRLRFTPGKADNHIKIVARNNIFRGIGLHQVKFLKLLINYLFYFPFKFKSVNFILESLIIGALGIGSHSQLAFYRLEFLFKKIIPLGFFNLFIDFFLNLFLNPQQFLFFFDKYQHLLHTFAYIENFKNLLLFRPVNVKNTGNEIGDFAGMIDIDHVEAHLFGEQGVILGNLLHLGNKGAGKRLYFAGIIFFFLKVLHRRYNGVAGMESLLYPKTLKR